MDTTSARSGLGIVALLLAAVLFVPLLFGGMMGMGMAGSGATWHDHWMGFDGQWSWWWFAASLLGRLLVLAVVIGGGYLLVKSLGGGQPSDSALDELRRAYARGDLTDEEFDRRRERLERD
ncbi:SHOCT domain-containing protein [Haloarchaeobius sp. DYHT-AS-18]|uniref:SHOCT domain-containing protein n=1 Tax=Haloarchaeobius sp. DYHT-AS-18 TaxID=3446117 RepID=UPI003EC1531D